MLESLLSASPKVSDAACMANSLKRMSIFEISTRLPLSGLDERNTIVCISLCLSQTSDIAP